MDNNNFNGLNDEDKVDNKVDQQEEILGSSNLSNNGINDEICVSDCELQQVSDFSPSREGMIDHFTAKSSNGESNKKKAKKHGVLPQMIAVSLISSIIGGAFVGSYFKYIAPEISSPSMGYSSNQLAGSLNTGVSQGTLPAVNKVAIEASNSPVTEIAQKAGPSVVGIKSTAQTRDMFGIQQGGGEGSGIIYSSDGYIVTNFHVIQDTVDTTTKKVANGAKIEVILPNQMDKPYTAQIVGYDSRSDLAVIKIQAANLPAIELGNSDDVKVGDMAVAIGNPGGLEYMGSVTTGIISGLNRTIQGEGNSQFKLIQTDAAINPGNSGGALLNSKGQVIGINSVKIVEQGFEGLGFAIPVNTVKDIANNLINFKYVKGRSYLGISVDQRFNEQIAQQNNVPAGVLVQDVAPVSGAYKAGIQAGDIITKFGGQIVKSYDDLNNLKSKYKPGDTVAVEVYRDGKTQTVQVKLTEDMNN